MIRIFQSYSWPGNLRQMKNAIKYATLLATGRYITRNELPEELTANPVSAQVNIQLKNESHECEMIKRALQEAGNNKTRAAQLPMRLMAISSKITFFPGWGIYSSLN